MTKEEQVYAELFPSAEEIGEEIFPTPERLALELKRPIPPPMYYTNGHINIPVDNCYKPFKFWYHCSEVAWKKTPHFIK